MTHSSFLYSLKEFNAKDHWENILAQNYGLKGTGYVSLGKNYNNWLYKVKLKSFLKAVQYLNIPNIKTMDVIDIGSGTGFFIDAWKSLGVKNISGIDITKVAVENLRRKFPADKFYEVDIGDNITVPKQQYDIASSFDVLYHIIDDNRYTKAIENIYSLLRYDGFFIFSENFLHKKGRRAIDQVDRTLTDVERILRGTGFKIVNRTPEFVIMNNPIDSSKLRSLLWVGMMLPVQKSEFIGSIYGAALYPVELFLMSRIKESPSTEIMVCKK